MKRSIALLLTLLLTVSAYPATAEVTASETNVFFESTEITPARLDKVAQIPAGTEYTVLRTLDGADESLAWSEAWTKDYRMAQIRYQSDEGEKTGWIAVEAKAHPLDTQPELTGEYGAVLTVPSRETGGSSLSFAASDKAKAGQSSFTGAGTEDMAVEDALRLALDAVMGKYGQTEGQLLRFRVSYGYRAEGDYFEGPYWQFDLDNPVNALDAYEVMVHSHDGHIIYICGPGEGNG